MRALRQKYLDNPKGTSKEERSKLIALNAEWMKKSDGEMLTDYESPDYKNEMMHSGADEETIIREADRKVSVNDTFDLNSPWVDPVKRTSMVQDDMKAFIYLADFDNDFQADNLDEF